MVYGRRRARQSPEHRGSPAVAQSTSAAGGTPVVYTTPRLSVNTGDSNGSNYVGRGGDDETDTAYRLATNYGHSVGEGNHSNASTPVANIVTPGREMQMRTSVSCTPQGAMALKYPYNCPLCFEYFADILYTPGCCGNYICVQCCVEYLGTQGISSDSANINEVLAKLKKDQLKDSSDTSSGNSCKVSCPQCLNSARPYVPEKVEKDISSIGATGVGGAEGVEAELVVERAILPTATPVKYSEGIAYNTGTDSGVNGGAIAGIAQVNSIMDSPRPDTITTPSASAFASASTSSPATSSTSGSPSTHSDIDRGENTGGGGREREEGEVAASTGQPRSVSGRGGRPPLPTSSMGINTNINTNNSSSTNVVSIIPKIKMPLHSPVKVGDSFETLKRKMRMGSFKRELEGEGEGQDRSDNAGTIGDDGVNSSSSNNNSPTKINSNGNNSDMSNIENIENQGNGINDNENNNIDNSSSNSPTKSNDGTNTDPDPDPLEDSDDGLDTRPAEDIQSLLNGVTEPDTTDPIDTTDMTGTKAVMAVNSYVDSCVREALQSHVNVISVGSVGAE